MAASWLDRVTSDGRLPPGAATLLVNQFQTLQDLGQSAEAALLLKKLPALLQAQEWDDSAYFSRWETLANRLRKAGQPEEARRILNHLLKTLETAPISQRNAAELKLDLQKALQESVGA
jgi:tetratricopeptide (TPR) repeat protein